MVDTNLFAYIILLSQSLVYLFSGWVIYKYTNLFYAFCFIIYFQNFIVNNFDFHIDVFIIPLNLFFFIFYEKKRFFLYTFFAIAPIFVKEIFALQTIFFGIFIILDNFFRGSLGKKKLFVSLFIIFLGFLTFYLITVYLIPIHSNGFSPFQTDAFSYLGNSLSQIIKNILLFNFEFSEIKYLSIKLKTILIFFSSFIFLCFLKPLYLIPTIPFFLVSFFSTNPSHFNHFDHHLVGITVPLFWAFYKSLEKIEINRLIKVIVIAYFFIFNVLISNSFFSYKFLSDKINIHGYKNYFDIERDNKIKQLIKKYVPDDKNVSVSVQNNILSNHLPYREKMFLYPYGVVKNNKFEKAEFVILDSKRELYLYDESCVMIYDKCSKPGFEREYYKMLKKLKSDYNNIISFDNFYIFRLGN